MIFTSGTQARDGRSVNHDPLPVLNLATGGRHTDDGYGALRGDALKWEPRPEFDVLDNSVLALFRKQLTPLIPIRAHAIGFLNGITRLASEGFSIAEINHARRVLTKLAALTKEAIK